MTDRESFENAMRPELEKLLGPHCMAQSVNIKGEYAQTVTEFAWRAWQTSRSTVSVRQGWKLVPIEPTVDMYVDGFEAVGEFHDTDEYREMAGCKGAAESAKICWAAMVDAAPSSPETPTEFEKHGELDADGWTPYVFPERQYWMQCCDCGLVHEMEFAAVKTEQADGDGFHSEELPWPENRVRFRVRRAVARLAERGGE